MFISQMAFQDVNKSGTVVVNPLAPTQSTDKQQNPKKTEADRDEELARSVIEDDQDDSYEELQHSLPMEFVNNQTKKDAEHKSTPLALGKPDRIDQLLFA